MSREDVITGQRVTAEKVQQAQAFRRQQTPTEQLLWQRLRASRFHGLHFRRQQIIDGFIVDSYCHAVGLVMEVDGPVHEEHESADAERDRILQSRGLTVLRVTNDDVQDHIERVLQRILDTVDSLKETG